MRRYTVVTTRMTREITSVLRVRDKSELLVLVEDYLGKVKIGATKFGWLATGDMGLVSKLRHKTDYDPQLSTVTKVLDFLMNATEEEVEDDETEEDIAEGL
jgi:hypothetical protein